MPKPRRKKVSFLAKTDVKRRVAFHARGSKVSFVASMPSKRRKRVTFYTKKKSK